MKKLICAALTIAMVLSTPGMAAFASAPGEINLSGLNAEQRSLVRSVDYILQNFAMSDGERAELLAARDVRLAQLADGYIAEPLITVSETTPLFTPFGAEEGNVTINGTVVYSYCFGGERPITVGLYTVAGDLMQMIPLNDNEFTVLLPASMPRGNYYIQISKGGHLTARVDIKLRDVSESRTFDVTARLISGDINGDGVIDLDGDAVIVRDTFNLPIDSPYRHPYADINGDGVVTLAEIGMVVLRSGYRTMDVRWILYISSEAISAASVETFEPVFISLCSVYLCECCGPYGFAENVLPEFINVTLSNGSVITLHFIERLWTGFSTPVIGNVQNLTQQLGSVVDGVFRTPRGGGVLGVNPDSLAALTPQVYAFILPEGYYGVQTAQDVSVTVNRGTPLDEVIAELGETVLVELTDGLTRWIESLPVVWTPVYAWNPSDTSGEPQEFTGTLNLDGTNILNPFDVVRGEVRIPGPDPHFRPTANHTTVYHNGWLIIMGGFAQGFVRSYNQAINVSNVNYEIGEIRWLAEMPIGRYGHTATLVGSRIFVVGGSAAGHFGLLVPHVDIFCITTNIWSRLDIPVQSRCCLNSPLYT